MASRKELAHEEGRKPNRVGIKVVQFRSLAAPLRNKMSRVDCDVKGAGLKPVDAVRTMGTSWIRWELIIQLKRIMYGLSPGPHNAPSGAQAGGRLQRFSHKESD